MKAWRVVRHAAPSAAPSHRDLPREPERLESRVTMGRTVLGWRSD